MRGTSSTRPDPAREAPVPSSRTTSSRPGVPARYWAWLTGVGISMTGMQVLGFAMAWIAAGDGGWYAGLVLAAIHAPKVLLMLIGGAVADRWGPWRVMITGDAAMTLVTGVFAIVLLVAGPGPVLLVSVALLLGTVDAFYVPASGSLPRRLLPDAALARGMSARQLVSQLGAMVGAPLGGVVVAGLGISAAAAINSGAYAFMFILLLVIRPRPAAGQAEPRPATSTSAASPPEAARATSSGPARPDGDRGRRPGILAQSLDGLRLAAGEPLLRQCLALLLVAAGALIPVTTLLVPVLGRQHHWPAATAGLVAGATAAGTIVVAAYVTLAGAVRRPGVGGCAGLGLAATGIASLALVGAHAARWQRPVTLPLVGELEVGTVAVMLAGAAIGAGAGIFSTHMAPLVLRSTPPEQLSRVQAVVALAQSLPLLLANLALGTAADVVGSVWVLWMCAASLALAATAGMLSGMLRSATLSP